MNNIHNITQQQTVVTSNTVNTFSKNQEQQKTNTTHDRVSISDEARKRLEQDNEPQKKLSASMSAYTDFGTKVTVEAHSLTPERFTIGTAWKQDSQFMLSESKQNNTQYMQFTATFMTTDGTIESFILSGNTVFRETEDGSILKDTKQGAGSSHLQGTDESEIFVVIEDNTTVNTSNGNNRVFNMALNTHIIGGVGNDIITSLGNNTTIESGDGDDTITILEDTLRLLQDNLTDETQGTATAQAVARGAQQVFIDSGAGNDSVVSEAELVTSNIQTGDGDDNLSLQQAVGSVFDFGSGDDRFVADTLLESKADLGSGDDTVTLNMFNSGMILGGDGNDQITINTVKNSRIDGGDGNDSILIDYAETSQIGGGSGDDFIRIVTSLDSTVDGGSGNDVVIVQTVLESLNADKTKISENPLLQDTKLTPSQHTDENNPLNPPTIIAVGEGNSERVVSGA